MFVRRRDLRVRHSSKNANKSGTQRARIENQRAARANAAEEAAEDAAWGARQRYSARACRYRQRYGVVAGPLLHRLAWLVHNCVAHPVLGVAPSRLTVALHDRTADVLNLATTPTSSPLPAVERPLEWLLHNCVAHPLIGLAPRASSMAWHDDTAEDMDEQHWL